MKPITLLHPRKLVFGNGCISQFVTDFRSRGYKRLLVITTSYVKPLIENTLQELRESGIQVFVEDSIDKEPDVNTFNKILNRAVERGIDSVAGIGGGSVLDVAKLVAALCKSDQTVEEVFGIGNLNGRSTYLACLPTTAGTGSEVSPNAILLDPAEQIKKGVISPYLVPDASYVDPELTRTVPPPVTAATGIDALTHCIEAYTNKYAHPVIDLYALKGIELIGANLKKAVDDGNDLQARAALALGSLYGGMCLGPVNTAAVHALAYPLGGEFHVAHGLSNAVLLPYVMEFNLTAATHRYVDIARALGVKSEGRPEEIARAGVEKVRELVQACGLPLKLSRLNIPREAIPRMAKSALTVTRLLKNNPREVTLEDAIKIYEWAY